MQWYVSMTYRCVAALVGISSSLRPQRLGGGYMLKKPSSMEGWCSSLAHRAAARHSVSNLEDVTVQVELNYL